MELATRRAILVGCLAATLAYSLAALVADRYVTAEGAYREAFYAEHRGDTARRVDALSRGLKAYPLHTRLLLHVGRYHWQELGDRRKADLILSMASSIRPFSADAAACYGTRARMMGKRQMAGESFERAVMRDPGFAEAWYALGSVYIAQERLNKAIVANQHALRIDPNFSMAWNNLGVALRDSGRVREGIRAARRALAIDPDREMFNSNIGLHLEDVDPEKALAVYLGAVKANPDDTKYWRRLCRMAQELERKDLLLTAGRELTGQPYATASHHVLLGHALAGLGETNAALSHGRAALKLEPRNQEARKLIATLENNATTARTSKVPNNAGRAEQARFYGKAGDIDLESQNFAAAAESYRKAIALNPTEAAYHYNLALALLHTHTNIADVTEEMRRAVLLEPGDMQYRMALAEHLNVIGEHHAAVALLTDVQERVGPDLAAYRDAQVMLDDARAFTESAGQMHSYTYTNADGRQAVVLLPAFIALDPYTGARRDYNPGPDDECYFTHVAQTMAMEGKFDHVDELISRAMAARAAHPCPDWVRTDDLYISVGISCLRDKNLRLAERSLRFVMQNGSEPKSKFKAAHVLARHYVKLGRGEEAVAVLEDVMARLPDNGIARSNMLQRLKDEVASQTPPGAAR